MNEFKAFTLVELVIVIILIGLLAGIALPKFVDLGKDAALQANQKIFRDFAGQIDQAHTVYTMKRGANKELDWNQDGQTDLKFEYDYPVGARPKGAATFYEMELSAWGSIANTDACSEIFNALIRSDLNLSIVDWSCFNAGVNRPNCFKDPDIDICDGKSMGPG